MNNHLNIRWFIINSDHLMEMGFPVWPIPGRRMLHSSAHGDVVVSRTESSIRLGPRGASSAGPLSLEQSFNWLESCESNFKWIQQTAHLFRKANNITIDYIIRYSGLRCRRIRNGFSIRKSHWTGFYVTLHHNSFRSVSRKKKAIDENTKMNAKQKKLYL